MPATTTINFQQQSIAAGETKDIRRNLLRGGRVVRLFTQAVVGEEADVHRTWVIDTQNERKNILLDATDGDLDSETYLAGSGTTWDLPVDHEFSADDELVLEVDNQDQSNQYPTIAYAVVAFGDGPATRKVV